MSEFAAIPLPPENNEELLISGLIVMLHFHHENAAELQAAQFEAHTLARQPLRSTNFLITSLNDEGPHVPTHYDRVVFGPQHDEPARYDIARIITRYPVVTQDFYPENTLGQPWNDIFLEVQSSDGICQDYLLNGNGLLPFNNAQHEVAEDSDYLTTGNLFRVKQGGIYQNLLTLKELNELLPLSTEDYDAYVYLTQPNDEELLPVTE